MGQRNNYILIDKEGNNRIAYAHWDAPVLGRKLFYGPEELERYILSHLEASEEIGLLDDVFAEGGIILDFSQHKVAFWGEEYLDESPFMIPYFCQMLSQTLWKGWQVEWLFYGQLAMAESVGQDSDYITVIEAEHKPKTLAELQTSLAEADENPYEYTLVIRRKLQQYHCYVLPFYIEDIMPSKDGLLALLDTLNSTELSKALKQERLRNFIYIDTLNREVNVFWGRAMHSVIKSKFSDFWEGWQVILQNNGWQWLRTHFDLPSENKDEIVSILLEMISDTTDNANPGRAIIQRLVEQFRNAGHNVQVNDNSLHGSDYKQEEDAQNNRVIELWKWIDEFKKQKD